jgi:hypothetical protein
MVMVISSIDDDDSAGTGRAKWNIRKWAKEHNLHGPIAANFYQAQNL